jgi:hypothetical protein
MLLLTDNRNMVGVDSLEQTIREENQSAAFPVVTIRAAFICMSPRPHTAQPERSEAKSKASLPTLRLRRSRGYAQSERRSTHGCIRVKTALVALTELLSGRIVNNVQRGCLTSFYRLIIISGQDACLFRDLTASEWGHDLRAIWFSSCPIRNIHRSTFFTHHSSLFTHFSPALRNAAICRSSVAGSLMGTLSL